MIQQIWSNYFDWALAGIVQQFIGLINCITFFSYVESFVKTCLSVNLLSFLYHPLPAFFSPFSIYIAYLGFHTLINF